MSSMTLLLLSRSSRTVATTRARRIGVASTCSHYDVSTSQPQIAASALFASTNAMTNHPQSRNLTTTTKMLVGTNRGISSSLDSVSSLRSGREQPLSLVQHQQVRFKRHAAKMGHHLERLDEMAHEKSHEEAREKRQKKKEKKAARKGKKNKGGGGGKQQQQVAVGAISTDESTSSNMDDIFEDDVHHSDDEHHDEEDEEDEEGEVLPDPAEVEERMMTIVNRFSDSLKTMRGAEPTVELFDDVVVNAYGESNTSLQSVALVVLESPTLAIATCYDPALAKNVCSAIAEKLQLNPSIVQDDSSGAGGGGATIRIPLPRVSLEVRQQTAAALGKRAEANRQKIRKLRRKALDVVKQGVAGKLEHISKDDAFRVQKEIENMTDQVISKLNDICDKKHDSIMAV